jgi:hypothetical protein
MGQFVFYSEVSRDLYDTAYKWMGRLPGGIALATDLASTGFAACCGVSLAGTAAMAAIAYPEMEKLNSWFEKGWEYVETLQQRISTGSSSARYPCVGVILRKEKQTDPLN